MNIILWILQILLALHTITGAIWKFSNSEQTMGSLNVIPHGVWLGMSVIELLCSLGLVLAAFNKSLGKLIPIAAILIAAEMLFFTGLQISSGDTNYSSVIYWLIVAAFCAFIAYGRLVLRPIHKTV
jgi:hypothetical protein